MFIQSRSQLKKWIQKQFPDHSMHLDSSVFWLPEEDLLSKCKWFAIVPCVFEIRKNQDISKTDYWAWCNENLQGSIRCFWSNPDVNQECWGFTDKNDIEWWLLRWHQ